MEFEAVVEAVRDVPEPHIPPDRGRSLYNHLRETRPRSCLELGTARGVSAAYIAAALELNGAGRLTTVDSSLARWQSPTAEELLGRLNLLHRVEIDRSYSTYTWFLKEQLEARSDAAGNCDPIYDFCFLDGGKNWTVDGYAVVLIEKLLRPGGWLLMDDLGWTYSSLPPGHDRHYAVSVSALSERERTQPHVRAVFELIVMQHPSFTEFRIQDDWWGWARKLPDQPRRLSIESTRSVRSIVVDGLAWVRRRLEGRIKPTR